ncbi:hypothetical protein NYG88_04385 [Campylobacter felis]|uniref:hypothetical protein n=1 Tax=Campylobacter felis TaxID=2974565 RepID=UPI00256406F5|nr:hypothetical protein [Campylobacter felis]
MANIKQISDKDMLDIILDIFEYMALDVNDLSMVYLELSFKNTREFDSVIINMLNYYILNILNHIKYARTRDYNHVDILAGTSFDKEE